MKRILCTGAGGPAGINFITSLQISLEKMFFVGTEANEYFLHLMPTDKKYKISRALEADYIDNLNSLIEKEKIEFLHAQPDVEVQVVSENRERIKANLFLPSKMTVSACQDKLESAKRWTRKAIPVASTLELKEENDVETAFLELGRPIWIRATHGAGGRGSTLADNKETASSWINYWKSRGVDWKFIAQEHLPGRNIAFHSLWKNGELITSMARERLEYVYSYLAPSGVTGTPAVQRTIHNKTVNETATKAVLAIDNNFNGIASVDLKEDKNGEPCVTEINPGRMFTTSFFFSYASKILRKDFAGNIPYLYVKLAYGEEIPKLPTYNILPENIYWIRHIDAPARLVRDHQILGAMYT